MMAMEGVDIQADGTASIDIQGLSALPNQWIREIAVNSDDYGDDDTLLVYSPVWDAVRESGVYWAGGWTNTVFTPEKMADYMPFMGRGESTADPDGNFHMGLRISVLTWADLVIISRPDPAGDAFVSFLFKNASGTYQARKYKWDEIVNGKKKFFTGTVVPYSCMTQEYRDELGFDPYRAIEDEGWRYRLKASGKNPAAEPVTLFVLRGRDGADTYNGNDPKNPRPVTRSVFNDRIWKAPRESWGWEFNTPEQRDNWITDAPDGKIVKWKDDERHQWRQLVGQSHIVRPHDKGKSRLLVNESVTAPDGTVIEVYVVTGEAGAKLDDAVYGLTRYGGYVIDYIRPA